MKTTDSQNELLTQVDSQNHVIGPVERGVAHTSNNLCYRTVYVLVKNKNGEILLQKRSHTKDLYPNCWDISVGGHVIYGDDYEETARRELKEELGINTKVGDLKVRGDVQVILPRSREFFRVFEYVLTENDSIKIEKKEVSETTWMTMDSIKESMKAQSIKWYARPIQTIKALY